MLRARFWVKLVDGLRLYSEGERVPAGSAAALEGGATAGWASAWRWTSGGSAAPSACTGTFPGTGGNGGSVAARLHVTGERGPELVGPAYVVRVSLEGLDDDRAFVALVRSVRSLAADKPVAAVLFKIENVSSGPRTSRSCAG